MCYNISVVAVVVAAHSFEYKQWTNEECVVDFIRHCFFLLFFFSCVCFSYAVKDGSNKENRKFCVWVGGKMSLRLSKKV